MEGRCVTSTATTLKRPRAVLFDLDGTLIDSAPDLAASVNIVLGLHGFVPLALPAVIAMIGNGIRKLVERAFAASGVALSLAELDAAYDEMMAVYGGHLTVATTLNDGARDTMVALAGAGIALGVVTNKPQRLTETILDHFHLSDLVGAVVGGDAGFERKPAPDMLEAALARLGVAKGGSIMVGDSRADVESAKAAGIPAVVVRGGYTTVLADDLGADRVIDRLPDLLALLGAAEPVTG